MNPKYPVYIPSRGRANTRLTMLALDAMQVPYHVVIEAQEYAAYAAVLDPAKILVLPFEGKGLIASRCWILDHAIAQGAAKHWQIDDNIRDFFRLHANIKYRVDSGAIFRAIEDFTDRYTNIAYAGMQYEMFAPRIDKHKPLILNTRIYSCTLINHAVPYRWRSIYNDDTDVCLQALKDGWCTVLFVAFLANKMPTMTVKGGNTEQLYILQNGQDGRLLMAQALQQLHPDVVQVKRKWGRWQHQVNYKPFKGNQLILKPGAVIPTKPNEYGMQLMKKQDVQ